MLRSIVICNTHKELSRFRELKPTDTVVLLLDNCPKGSDVKCLSIFEHLSYQEIRRSDWLAYRLLRMYDTYLEKFDEYKIIGKYIRYIFDSVYSHYTPVSRMIRRLLFIKKAIESLHPNDIILINVPPFIIPWNTIVKYNIHINTVFDFISLLYTIMSYYEPLILPELNKIIKHRFRLYSIGKDSTKPVMTTYLLQLWYDIFSHEKFSSLISLFKNMLFEMLYRITPKYYMIVDYTNEVYNADIVYVVTFTNSVRSAYPIVMQLQGIFNIIGIATHIDGLTECKNRNLPCVPIGNYLSKIFTSNLERNIVNLAKHLYLYFMKSELNKPVFEILRPALVFHSIFAIPYGMALIIGFKEFFKLTNPRLAISFDDIGFAGRLFVYTAREHGIETITFQHSVIDDILRYKDTIADFMCVWGRFCKDLLAKYGVPYSKLVITGPLRDIKVNKDISINIDRILKRKIVIAWFPTKYIDADVHVIVNKRELECILNGINSFINNHHDWTLLFIIKIHPQDEPSFYEKILDEIKHGLNTKLRNNIIITDVPIEKILNNIDLVLVTNSTAAIEAILSGKIIGYINCSSVEETLPLVKYNAAIPIRCSNEMEKVLNIFTDVSKLSTLINKLKRGRIDFLKYYLNNGTLDYGRIIRVIHDKSD